MLRCLSSGNNIFWVLNYIYTTYHYEDTYIQKSDQIFILILFILFLVACEFQYYALSERRRLTSEQSNTIRKKKNFESSWKIEKNYSCMVQTVGGLNVDPGRLVEVIIYL